MQYGAIFPVVSSRIDLYRPRDVGSYQLPHPHYQSVIIHACKGGTNNMSILSDLSSGNKPRAERATVVFGNSVFSIDGYRLLDTGEFRAGLSGASELVGYERKWLSEVGRKQTKTLEVLRNIGYTGRMIEVQVSNDRSGTRALTIDLDDLRHVIRYAASYAKPPKQKAIQLADGQEYGEICTKFSYPLFLGIDPREGV
jgi:hypothetical protein